MKKIILLYTILACSAVCAQAQTQILAPGLRYQNLRIERNEATNMVDVAFRVMVDKNVVKSNYALNVTPQFKDARNIIDLPGIQIRGKRFQLSESRHQMSGDEPMPEAAFMYDPGQSFEYTASVPWEEWMSNKIDFRSQWSRRGCCDETVPAYQVLASGLSLIPPPPPVVVKPEPVVVVQPVAVAPTYEPKLTVSYVIPEVEEVKMRSEQVSAYLEFVVARAEIDPYFRNNAFELNKIYRLVDELRNDPYATVTGVTIKGYASPEASFYSNLQLSDRRAMALKFHLQMLYRFDERLIMARGFGEDWTTLDSLVLYSPYMSDKYGVLNVIRSYMDPDRKENMLKRVSRGLPYRQIVNEFYPKLRRSDVQIHYSVIPFTVETGREVFRTKPSSLSLNEMFLLAQEYYPGDEEFNEIFATAVRLFPRNDVANINAAAVAIDEGNIAAANRYLSRVQNKKQTAYLNNMGILYYLQEDEEMAMECFEKARFEGNMEARRNAIELNKRFNSMK